MTTTNPGGTQTLWINNTNGHVYRDDIDLEVPMINDYDAIFETYHINGQVMIANVETQLINWTKTTGTANTFAPTTGLFTPTEGVYQFGLFVGVTTNANTSHLSCILKENLTSNIRYVNTLLTSDLAVGPGNPWEGAVTFNASNYFLSTDVLNVNVKIDSSETCDFILRIIKIL